MYQLKGNFFPKVNFFPPGGAGGYILQNKYVFRLERYSHILIWCERILIKGPRKVSFGSVVFTPGGYILPNILLQGAIFFQTSNALRMEGYLRTLKCCRRIFIKCHTHDRECRKKCFYIQLVYPFNNEMIWFVILMHQKPFLSLKTSLFQVYGNIEIVEGYSSQIYTGGKQFNLLEEYSPLWPWKPQKWTGHPKKNLF